MNTPSKASAKLYACKLCGYETMQNTNHYGETYSVDSYNACPNCPPFRRPNTWVCQEKLPGGVERPTNWKTVTIIEG